MGHETMTGKYRLIAATSQLRRRRRALSFPLYVLKALYQHIVAKIEIVTSTFRAYFCIFLGQENGNVRIRDPVYYNIMLIQLQCLVSLYKLHLLLF